jgi:hypothetical protein
VQHDAELLHFFDRRKLFPWLGLYSADVAGTRQGRMPLFVPKTLLQSAQGGAQTKRYRDFVIAYFEGEGAVAVPIAIWTPAASWAHGRQPSGNRLRDRTGLLQRLDVLVTRRGTTVTSTTGGMVPLARLRNSMKGEGVDLKEWNFPPDSVLDAALDPNAGKDRDKPAEAAAVDPAADPGVGQLVRSGERAARSSSGYEVRGLDQGQYEYREGGRGLVLRGLPGGTASRPSFLLKPGAWDNWPAPEGVDPALARSRAARNFAAALAFLGVDLIQRAA